VTRANPVKARRSNRHSWLLEALLELPECVVRPMFGCQACYFNGLLVLVLADSEEPWRGVLVPVERENQAAIIRDFPALAPHPVLPKWLYLPEACASFEGDAQRLVERIRRLDPRFGVLPERERPGRRRPARKRKAG
jgi:hypothetical protein